MRALLLCTALLLAACGPSPDTAPATASTVINVQLEERRELADRSVIWKFSTDQSGSPVFCWIREREIDVTPSMRVGDWVAVDTDRCSSFINDFDSGRL